MSTVAVVLALIAITISLGSLYYVRTNVGYSKRGVEVAERNEHLALTPKLVVTLQPGMASDESQWVYRLRNDSDQDLGAVTVHPPTPAGGAKYPLATVGGSDGWNEGGPTELGPLPMGSEALFQLAVGPPTPGHQRPVFRVRVRTTSGEHTWEAVYILDEPPRPPRISQARMG